MRQRNAVAAVILIAVIGAGATAPLTAPKYPASDFTGATAYRVVKIIDGDTVKLSINGKPETVSLLGINTPEAKQRKKSGEGFGQEAAIFLTNLLKGESVYVKTDPESTTRDKSGRGLAYLYRAPDGLFVNLEIVRQGYGRVRMVNPFSKIALFRAYETRAMQTEKGLWGASQEEN